MAHSTIKRGVAAILIAAGLTGCQADDAQTREAQRQIREALAALPAPASRREAQVAKDVRTAYEKLDYRPVWIDGRRPGRQWDRLLQALEGARKHGLDPEAYDLEGLRRARAEVKRTGLLRREEMDAATVGTTDVRLSYAFMRYATHLLRGEVDPQVVDEQWIGRGRSADLPAALAQVRERRDVQVILDPLTPQHPGYVRLVQALERSDAARARQIALNLDRWRWLPADLGERHLIVNIPSYDLALVEGGREVTHMRVVVGKKFDPTPVFSDEITYITFNPQWNVPESILTEEILPLLREDESYLEKHEMEVVKDKEVVSLDDVDLDDPKSFRIRQRPGAKNPLGQVKFVFPNQFDVYLHDTPADALFAREERAFSHGCVRVEKPIDLAAHLLRDQSKWDRDAIQKAIASGEEQSVTLAKPLPVHIVYWTAWADENGALQLGDDVYGHDRTQSAVLDRLRPKPERQAAR